MNVSEKGTEASAATGGGLTPTAMPAPPPVTIVFDHPFLFLVRDNATGTVIFEAQVSDPSSTGGWDGGRRSRRPGKGDRVGQRQARASICRQRS